MANKILCIACQKPMKDMVGVPSLNIFLSQALLGDFANNTYKFAIAATKTMLVLYYHC